MAQKAKLYIKGQNDPLTVMFNPEQYSISQEIEYSGEKEVKQYVGFKYNSFELSLFFDTYEEEEKADKDVRKKYTDKFAGLIKPVVPGQERNQPPECIFTWGSFAIRGEIQKVIQKFTMFLQDGTPVRAELTITFNPTKAAKDLKELMWQACRKHYRVKSGDRLDLIAHRTLKDPKQWRKIAKLNNITNPYTFPAIDDVGKIIIIPD